MNPCSILHCENYSNNVTLSFFAASAIALAVVVRNAAASERKFTLLVFPPTICEDDGRTIYTSLLPPTFIAALLFTMLFVIGVIIHKVRLKYPHCYKQDCMYNS